MKLWITRPIEATDALADQVRRRGWTPVVDPLLAVEVGTPDVAAISGMQALVATSARALAFLGICELDQDVAERLWSCPLFAVGPGTALAARAAGFVTVMEGPGRARDLVSEVVAYVSGHGDGHVDMPGYSIGYLRGEQVAYDIAPELEAAGFSVHAFQTYRARETSAPSAATCADIRNGTITAVMLLSPRTAAIYAKAMERTGLAFRAPHLIHYCLSQDVADQIRHLQPMSVVIPDQPNLHHLLAVVAGPAAQSVQ